MNSKIDGRLRRLESAHPRQVPDVNDVIAMRPDGDVVHFVYRGSVVHTMAIGDALDIDWGDVSSIPTAALSAIVTACEGIA